MSYSNKLHQVRSKPNNLKAFKARTPKGSMRIAKNRLRGYMPEGGEPYFTISITLHKHCIF